MVTRACEVCGKGYEAKRAASRYCSDTCRKRAQRMGGAPTPVLTDEDGSEGRQEHVGPVEQAVRAELEAVERSTTALGVQTILLARRLDGSGRDPLQAVATLQRRLAEALTEATAGTHVQRDEFDELRDRRERKHAG